jgi:hypothetical protein
VNDDAIPDMKKGQSVNIAVTAQVTGACHTPKNPKPKTQNHQPKTINPKA